MVSTIHERTISLLQLSYPESARTGFRKGVRNFLTEMGDSEAIHDFECHVIPDLWWIDKRCISVVCLEVEDASKISNRKMSCYEEMYWFFDFLDIELHLISSDRWGNLTPIKLFEYYTPWRQLEGNIGLGDLPEAEIERSNIVFDLTKIYAMPDPAARTESRARWLAENPGFDIREFLEGCKSHYKLAGEPEPAGWSSLVTVP